MFTGTTHTRLLVSSSSFMCFRPALTGYNLLHLSSFKHVLLCSPSLKDLKVQCKDGLLRDHTEAQAENVIYSATAVQFYSTKDLIPDGSDSPVYRKKVSILSGAVFAVFHSSIPYDALSALSKIHDRDHLLVYILSGHSIQYRLLPSLGEESSGTIPRIEPVLSAWIQEEDLRVAHILGNALEAPEMILESSDCQDNSVVNNNSVELHERCTYQRHSARGIVMGRFSSSSSNSHGAEELSEDAVISHSKLMIIGSALKADVDKIIQYDQSDEACDKEKSEKDCDMLGGVFDFSGEGLNSEMVNEYSFSCVPLQVVVKWWCKGFINWQMQCI
ncbi:Autophagy-related protein 18g, partial [Mucuna pruriens]